MNFDQQKSVFLRARRRESAEEIIKNMWKTIQIGRVFIFCMYAYVYERERERERERGREIERECIALSV